MPRHLLAAAIDSLIGIKKLVARQKKPAGIEGIGWQDYLKRAGDQADNLEDLKGLIFVKSVEDQDGSVGLARMGRAGFRRMARGFLGMGGEFGDLLAVGGKIAVAA